MKIKVAALLPLLMLSNPVIAIDLNGVSTATPQLKIDTLKSLIPMASAFSKCDQIDSVTMAIVTPPKNVQINLQGLIIKSDDIVERWTTSGCGKITKFKVTFSADGVGGMYFHIATEK